MRIFIIGFLLLCTIASAQDTGNHPWLEQQDPYMQELVKAYGADEAFLSAQDRMLEAEKRIEEARDRDRRTKTIFLVLSALAALYPAWKAVSMVRRGQLKAAGAAGVVAFALTILLGSAVLFAFNYGWLTLHYKMGERLYFPFSILFVAGLVVCSIVLLKKK